MKEELRDRFLDHLDKSTGESIEASLNTLKKTSFYAHVPITAFQQETDQSTIVTDRSDIYGDFAIGAKLKERDDGYLRLTGNLQTTNLQLILSQWERWDNVGSDRLKESLLHRPNGWFSSQDFVIISSDDSRHTGLSIPIKGNEKIQIQSDLRFEFAIGRWQIAPCDPERSFLWWTITKFIPKFMEEYVAPFADIPPQEMRSWVP